MIFLNSCCKIKTIKDNDYARPMKRGIECIRQEFIAEFPLKSKIKRVNTAIVFTLRFRWQEIILQRIKILQRKKVYVDDGASGSNFERTEFRRMLADIELGVINMVIFKDVSRLGREHIDTNYYLGKYFPEKQIRIVSILDNYDSAVGTYDEMLEIKTLLNDMYLRDTSRKIKTTIQTKRSMGEYTPKQPPFGYVKSKTIHNHLEIDPYAAEVVRRILQNVSKWIWLYGYLQDFE